MMQRIARRYGFREETRACQVRASLRSGKLVVVEAKRAYASCEREEQTLCL